MINHQRHVLPVHNHRLSRKSSDPQALIYRVQANSILTSPGSSVHIKCCKCMIFHRPYSLAYFRRFLRCWAPSGIRLIGIQARFPDATRRRLTVCCETRPIGFCNTSLICLESVTAGVSEDYFIVLVICNTWPSGSYPICNLVSWYFCTSRLTSPFLVAYIRAVVAIELPHCHVPMICHLNHSLIRLLAKARMSALQCQMHTGIPSQLQVQWTMTG